MLDGMCNDGRCLHYVLPAPLLRSYSFRRYSGLERTHDLSSRSDRAAVGPGATAGYDQEDCTHRDPTTARAMRTIVRGQPPAQNKPNSGTRIKAFALSRPDHGSDDRLRHRSKWVRFCCVLLHSLLCREFHAWLGYTSDRHRENHANVVLKQTSSAFRTILRVRRDVSMSMCAGTLDHMRVCVEP